MKAEPSEYFQPETTGIQKWNPLPFWILFTTPDFIAFFCVIFTVGGKKIKIRKWEKVKEELLGKKWRRREEEEEKKSIKVNVSVDMRNWQIHFVDWSRKKLLHKSDKSYQFYLLKKKIREGAEGGSWKEEREKI